MKLLQFMWADRFEILQLSVEHMFLVLVAIALAVLINVVAIWLLLEFGGRVYSGAVLQTGGRIKLRDAWRASR